MVTIVDVDDLVAAWPLPFNERGGGMVVVVLFYKGWIGRGAFLLLLLLVVVSCCYLNLSLLLLLLATVQAKQAMDIQVQKQKELLSSMEEVRHTVATIFATDEIGQPESSMTGNNLFKENHIT